MTMITCETCGTENTDDSSYCKRCGSSLDSQETTRAGFVPGETPAPASRLAPWKVGTLVAGRYRIDGFLGEGGMGMVYRVSDLETPRTLALKQLSPPHARSLSSLERFRREVAVARKLEHPNLVRVYDSGTWEGVSYLAMEYIEGENLKQKIMHRRTADLDYAVALLNQLSVGLEAIHSNGVVHRDIKPANVLIDAQGNVKLCDFGLAFTEGVTLTRLTQSGTPMGTPEYMAPEQIEGRRVDSRADIYSLGVLMYETLTGQLPFSGDSYLSVALQHLNRAPLPPRMRNPALPAHLDRLILKAMEKESAARYQSVAELRADLAGRRPRKTERHAVTGDLITQAARRDDTALVIRTRRPRETWNAGMALQFREAFYQLALAEFDGGSTHPYVYSFKPWPAGEVFRRLVNYDDLPADGPLSDLAGRWRRVFRR
jgi:serine/threonine-protein kinase